MDEFERVYQQLLAVPMSDDDKRTIQSTFGLSGEKVPGVPTGVIYDTWNHGVFAFHSLRELSDAIDAGHIRRLHAMGVDPQFQACEMFQTLASMSALQQAYDAWRRARPGPDFDTFLQGNRPLVHTLMSGPAAEARDCPYWTQDRACVANPHRELLYDEPELRLLRLLSYHVLYTGSWTLSDNAREPRLIALKDVVSTRDLHASLRTWVSKEMQRYVLGQALSFDRWNLIHAVASLYPMTAADATYFVMVAAVFSHAAAMRLALSYGAVLDSPGFGLNALQYAVFEDDKAAYDQVRSAAAAAGVCGQTFGGSHTP